MFLVSDFALKTKEVNMDGNACLPPHGAIAQELDHLRQYGDDDGLESQLRVIMAASWKPEHVDGMVTALRAYFDSEFWCLPSDEDAADLEFMEHIDHDEVRVLINRALRHLGADPMWINGPPDEDWADPDWVDPSWLESHGDEVIGD